MFTGIIEELALVTNIVKDEENIHLTIKSTITNELKIDQSVAHNGVCLTVVSVNGDEYVVTAIKETLDKTALGSLKAGDEINLERAMKMGTRLDGHIVQGHIDQTGVCKGIVDEHGSWRFTFAYDPAKSNVTIEKGSITIDGTSLTVVDSKLDEFSVAIIPYTFEHTRFKNYKIGDVVNLEFDVIGKYVSRLMELRKNN
ncbi:MULTISPECIES: riboflavin synthase [Galbibacter]|uniref:Riboflavin synthase n=1 Tax=Galbibacter pacificus TaxID=2996052 RepID=A0ABT6FS17_9FLAO|nr:riboflavin synthase [Galbibacter pacificus]MDG3582818.1 riboflavin synthase [Galbibacter pacificus]MDG3586063.1 riboflavin synthase [Galbibacter pacificus]